MKTAILVFPGTNRERDIATALRRFSGSEPRFVWHAETEVPPDLDLIVLPGGFAYGDYLRPGAMAAHSPILGAVKAAAGKGVHILGICNGFQILTEAGLLPGALMRNASLKFICRDVFLMTETEQSPYTAALTKGTILQIPVAHHDGNYFADPETLKRLEAEDRIAFRYCGPQGEIEEDWSLNGSQNRIAGILSENRRILGLMPHPENAIDPLFGSTDGAGLFRSLVHSIAG